MLGIISFSVFVTYFYNKKKNILVAVWIHFMFNMMLQIVIIEDFRFILYVSVLYLISSICIVLIKRKEMLSVQLEETSQTLQPG
jgi:membrane protease YdiL (CAAX protease family)